MTGDDQRVHAPDGYTSAGERWRAWCSCGWSTTPRVDQARARQALERQHGWSDAVCQLCRRERPGFDAVGRFAHLRLYSWEETGQRGGLGPEQWLACADDTRACHDLSAQRQLHLDKTAFDALGLELPDPRLRVIRGERTERPDTCPGGRTLEAPAGAGASAPTGAGVAAARARRGKRGRPRASPASVS